MLQKEKLTQAKNILKNLNVDLWITIGRETVMNSEPVLPFLSTLEFGGNTAILITQDKSICLAGHLDAYGMAQQNLYDEVVEYDKSFQDEFIKLLNKINPRQIALNYSVDVASDGLTHGMYLFITQILKTANYQGEIISSESIINKLRGIKTATELKAIKDAIAITETILIEAIDYIEAGKTQIEIHQFCQDRIKHYQVGNAWEAKHNPGVMFKNAPMGHAGPSDYTCQKGELVTLDFGVKVDDYCADIQRVYYILKDGENDVPEKYKKALADIQKAQDAGLALMRPKTPGYIPDEKARLTLNEMGYPEFNFGFGHQVGREAHDGGVMMGPRWERYLGKVEANLEAGMVLTVDINLPFDAGKMGQEDMALIEADQAIYLTTRQKEIYLCQSK